LLPTSTLEFVQRGAPAETIAKAATEWGADEAAREDRGADQETETDRANVFDIALLANRLVDAVSLAAG
jgi:hypothetical protein